MFSSNTSSAAGDANFVEDVFSTYLYTGNGSTQTITNGIDLAGKGGLTFVMNRGGGVNWVWADTARGVNKYISSNSTAAESSSSSYINAFNSNGFTGGVNVNSSGAAYASWTLREQPKFFDVVTYTGTGANRTIAHNLGSVPGCIIVKRTDTTGDWQVYHRSLASPTTQYGVLNSYIGTPTNSSTIWNSTAPTSTVFSLGTDATVNASGGTYVAYVFAHNAGGFGLTGTDNVISCGSLTADGSGAATVNLGYEAQWVLVKRVDNTQDWTMFDVMRGMSLGSFAVLNPNTSGAEGSFAIPNIVFPTSTGFGFGAGALSNSGQYIYIAIRRGPMKVPTDGTKVFVPVTYTGDGTASRVISAGAVSVVDMVINKLRDDPNPFVLADRLRGLRYLETNSTSSELTSIINFDLQDGVRLGNGASPFQNVSTYNYVEWNFRRAPGFFDEVCYTGTGSATTVTHNLAAVPELMIVKSRSGTGNWKVWNKSSLFTNLWLNSDLATQSDSVNSPTATTFSVFNDSNTSSVTYVAYLFATCPGVSKVGSYTGTGTTLQVNCGFTGGARFVLIKRTDSTGDWYVWDSARGIVSGNDPYLLLNSTAAEVTGTDYVDTFSSGFEISSTAPAAINANGGTFIFLAIA